MQASLLITDDIVDHSEERRGVPCWYKRDDVGIGNAINDTYLIGLGIYKLLKKHFSQHPYYLKMLESFHEVTLKTYKGQLLDNLVLDSNGRPNFQIFTWEHYKNIVQNKTTYYTYQLPVNLSMYLAKLNEDNLFKQSEAILKEIGLLFQIQVKFYSLLSYFIVFLNIQDDFLDCFGNPRVTGKIGTDIQDGKCSWLAVETLQRANSSQKQIMHENYGRLEENAIKTIKSLYHELNLLEAYQEYEEKKYISIHNLIKEGCDGLPHQIFIRCLNQLKKRGS